MNIEFKNLLSEIDYEDHEVIHNWMKENPNKLAFTNLFKDKIRVVLPPTNQKDAINILEKIKNAGYKIDFNAGLVSKDKPIKLGRFVLNNDMFTDKEKNWWNKSPNPIKQLESVDKIKNYSIILSRSPIDVLRMSDHKGLSSCHSPGGDYFKCAIAEAKGEGAIAYLVNKHDLDLLGEDELQDKEIFQDSDRNIKGIRPLARIRLRRFVNKKEGYEFAVPEIRTYGNKDFNGFYDTIKTWLLDKQKENTEGKRVRMKDFVLTGGTYSDTSASTLFNKMFDDKLDSGDAEYGGSQEGYVDIITQYKNELEQIEERYPSINCISYDTQVPAEGYDNDTVYINFNVYFKINLPEYLFNKESLKKFEINNKQINYYLQSELGFNYLEQLEMDEDYSISCWYSNVYDDPQRIEEYLSSLNETLNENYNKFSYSLYRKLQELGITIDNNTNNLVNHKEDQNYPLTNFEWEVDKKEQLRIMVIDPIKLGVLDKENRLHQNHLMKKENFKKELTSFVNNLEYKYFNNISNRQKFLFDPQIPKHKILTKLDLSIYPFLIDNIYYDCCRIEIDFDNLLSKEDFQKIYKFVQYIDDNFKQFCNSVVIIYNKHFHNIQSKQNLNQISFN